MAADNSIPSRSNVKDETGNPYGKLTVVSYAGSKLKALPGAYWNCLCECGNHTVVAGRALRNKTIQSCGCSKQRTNEVTNKYGKLTVIEFAGNTKSGDSRWLCRCECGNTTTVARGELKKESTISCGCHLASAGGGYKTTEYSSWSEIKARCYNPNDTGYHWYGGRGITMCEQWRHSFPQFLADMGKKPSPKHSVERINNDGNYEPGNCKWATTLEQGQNTRKTRLLTYNGETHGLREWARRLGITHRTMARRLDEQGWTMEQVVKHYTP